MYYYWTKLKYLLETRDERMYWLRVTAIIGAVVNPIDTIAYGVAAIGSRAAVAVSAAIGRIGQLFTPDTHLGGIKNKLTQAATELSFYSFKELMVESVMDEKERINKLFVTQEFLSQEYERHKVTAFGVFDRETKILNSSSINKRELEEKMKEYYDVLVGLESKMEEYYDIMVKLVDLKRGLPEAGDQSLQEMSTKEQVGEQFAERQAQKDRIESEKTLEGMWKNMCNIHELIFDTL